MSTGKFCWFDLMSTDVAAARAFYEALFGWEVRTHTPEYWMIHDDGGRSLGGMMTAQGGMPSAWLAYVTVGDLGATVAAIAAGGGTVHVRASAGDVGEFAIFSDPQGAVLAAIQPTTEFGPYPREKAKNHICWSELHTSDPAAALAFYTTLFGWASQAWGENYFMVGDEHAGGITAGQPGMPPNWLNYVNSQDTDATAAAVVRLGGRVIVPPQEMGGVGRFAVFSDPTGGVFAVMQSAPRP